MHTDLHSIPATQNTLWGFWGTLSERVDPAPLWPIAMTAIAEATGEPLERVRIFLDHRWGRHFADTVVNVQRDNVSWAEAVQIATDDWMSRMTRKACVKHYGVPKGLPQLTAHVIQAAIDAGE